MKDKQMPSLEGSPINPAAGADANPVHHERRHFIRLSGAAMLALMLPAVSQATERQQINAMLASLEKRIVQRRKRHKNISADWVLSTFEPDLTPAGKRIAIFELVRRVPYPALRDIYPHVDQIHSMKHLAGSIRLPKPLRPRHLAALIKKTGAQKALVWNQVADLRHVRIPCVYYEHGSAWYSHAPEQIQHCFSNVTEVIAVSAAAGHMLQQAHGIAADIHVLHNTLCPDKTPARDAVARTLDNKQIVLGVACRLVATKCVPLLVLTVKALQAQGINVKAKIAGVGAEENNIRQLIAAHQLQDDIELLGLVNNMAAFYRQIDCYVCTSLREPYGLSGLEAMAHGIPVIAANVDGLPEVIRHQHNGYCLEPDWSVDAYRQQTGASTDFCRQIYYPGDNRIGSVQLLNPDTIAAQIKQLIDNPAQYHTMSRRALETAQNMPPFQTLCDQILGRLWARDYQPGVERAIKNVRRQSGTGRGIPRKNLAAHG